jgi:hypothetical protein
MLSGLDVFQFDGKGPLWIGFAESVAQALDIARRQGMGRYLVFSQQTGHKETFTVDLQGQAHLTLERFRR